MTYVLEVTTKVSDSNSTTTTLSATTLDENIDPNTEDY